MIVDVDAEPTTAGIGPLSDSIPIGAAATTGVALGVVICAAESLLFRTVIGVPGPGTIPVINRLIAPNQAYVMVGGWVLAAAAGVLLAAARSGVVGWSTRPGMPAEDGAAVMAAIGLIMVAVPLSILAVSGEPGAISSWRAGTAGATAAAIGGGLALVGRRRLPLARTVLLAYAASFGAEVVLVRAVGRVSTAAWVEGSGSPAARIAQAMAFSSTWAVVAYAAAGALGAAVAMAAAPGTAKPPVPATESAEAALAAAPATPGIDEPPGATSRTVAAALTPPAGVILGLLVAGLATPATLHLSTHVFSRLTAGLAAASVTAAALQRKRART